MRLFHSLNKSVFIGLMVFLALSISNVSATEYECDSCSDCDTKLDNAGIGDIVKLNQSISINDSYCIYTETGVDNVTLDCQGYTISGNGNISYQGIRIGEYPNISVYLTIKNCTITNFGHGIYIRDGRFLTIHDIIAWNNTYSGINLWYAGGVELGETELYDFNCSYNGQYGLSNSFGTGPNAQYPNHIYNGVMHDNGIAGLYDNGESNIWQNLTIYNNPTGLYLYGSTAIVGNINLFQNITIFNNEIGIDCERWCRYNTFNDSMIYNNSQYGLFLNLDGSYGSYSNLIFNNYFNNTMNFYSDGGSSNWNSWNISKISGTNIIGGNYLGGNYWTNPTGTEYSDNCTDNDDYNGICDNAYTLDAYNIDYYPLTFPKPIITIYSPLNQTYQLLPIPLDVSSDIEIDTWFYQLNGMENVTFTPNTTISNISFDIYHLEVYGNESHGKIGYADIWFSYFDISPPNITIIEPERDISYQIVNVTLNVTDAISGVSGCLYNIDNGTNITYDFNGTNTIEDLDVGLHDLDVYCWDNANNTGFNSTIFGIGYFVEVCNPEMVELCEPFDQWTNAYCLDANTLRKEKICTIQWVENETMMYCNWEKHEDVNCDNGCFDGLTTIGSGCSPTTLEILAMTGGIFLIFAIASVFVMGTRKRKRR